MSMTISKVKVVVCTVFCCLVAFYILVRFLPESGLTSTKQVKVLSSNHIDESPKLSSGKNDEANKKLSKTGWVDSELLGYIDSDQSTTIIDALAYIWKNIDFYKNNDRILNAVLMTGLSHSDERISGLAGLITTMDATVLSERKVEVDRLNTHGSEQPVNKGAKDETPLYMQTESSESRGENLVASSESIELEFIVDAEEKTTVVINAFDAQDPKIIAQASQILHDNDESTRLAVTNGLISYLKDGVGDPQQVLNVLAENADYLSLQQLEEIQMTLAQRE